MSKAIKQLYKNAGLDNLWVERYDDHEIWHKSYNEMIKCMMKVNDWSRQVAIQVAKKECNKELLPFTAEKQLELMKWIFFEGNYYVTQTFFDDKYGFNVTYEDIDELIEDESFEIALAKTLNFMWKFMEDQEKAYITQTLMGDDI